MQKDREQNISSSVTDTHRPPVLAPPDIRPEADHRGISKFAIPALAAIVGIGGLTYYFATQDNNDGGIPPAGSLEPLPTPEPSDSPIPSMSAPIVTPKGTFELTFPPTVRPTEQATPVATETPANLNETPNLQENLVNWLAPEGDPNRITINNSERWYRNGGPVMNFGLATDITTVNWNHYIGYVLGAEKVGDNQVKIYLGAEDQDRNRYYWSGRLGTPVDPIYVYKTQALFSDFEGSPAILSANAFFDQLSKGAYHYNIFVSNPNKEAYRRGTPPYTAIEQSENEADGLLETATILLHSNLDPSKLPSFMNTTDTSYTDSPYIDEVIVRPIEDK